MASGAKAGRKAGRPEAGVRGELVLLAGGRPKKRKPVARDWSKAKERAFVETLAETCNVTLACAAAGVSTTSAYKKRKADAAFRNAWREAIGLAYQKLELVLIERALNGTEKIVTKGEGREERMREYPNHIALQLLKMHRETAVEAQADVPEDEVSEARQRVLEKLGRLRERITAQAADNE